MATTASTTPAPTATLDAYVDAIADGAAEPMSPAERADKQNQFASSFPHLANLLNAAHNEGVRRSA